MLHELCSKKLRGALILQYSEQIEEPLIEASNIGVLVGCDAGAGAKKNPDVAHLAATPWKKSPAFRR